MAIHDNIAEIINLIKRGDPVSISHAQTQILEHLTMNANETRQEVFMFKYVIGRANNYEKHLKAAQEALMRGQYAQAEEELVKAYFIADSIIRDMGKLVSLMNQEARDIK